MIATASKNLSFMNNTCVDVSAYHAFIVEAMKNNGNFSEELADIFVLTKTPVGSAVDYVLSWA